MPLLDAKEELGVLPDDKELERFIECFPNFTFKYRENLLKKYFELEKNEEELESRKEAKIKDKLRLVILEAKGIKDEDISSQQKGAIHSYIVKKVRSIIIRILFLRYHLDEGKTRVKANNLLLQRFDSKVAEDVGQSAIRKHTGKFKMPKNNP